MKTLVAFILGLVFVPILVAIAGILGRLPSDATSDPPKWESSAGMRALDASLEKRSSGLSNPVAANDPAALAAGAKIYADNCAGCHGSSKGPSDWGAKNFYPRAPQFLQEGSDVSPSEAFAAIHDGIRYSGMGAWRGQMKDEDMWKVANFVAAQRGKGGSMKDMD
ncbi:MAG TPA: cytochrome c [Sphingomicrobium sp.]|jgi:mono/diheme cytochrome c family protein|nr:cytochrome c [Sphingomicrobium sp.]